MVYLRNIEPRLQIYTPVRSFRSTCSALRHNGTLGWSLDASIDPALVQRIFGAKLVETASIDPALVQCLNKHAELLFGKEHVYQNNFIAPMPLPEQYKNPMEEELLGVEYVFCQSIAFKSQNYYLQKTVEAQEVKENEDDPQDEEEADAGYSSDDEGVDPLDSVNPDRLVTVTEEKDE